jgi:hypothetical protein
MPVPKAFKKIAKIKDMTKRTAADHAMDRKLGIKEGTAKDHKIDYAVKIKGYTGKRKK